MERLEPIRRKRKSLLEKIFEPTTEVASGMGVVLQNVDVKHGVQVPKELGNLNKDQALDVFTTMIGNLMLKGITDVQHMVAATGGGVHPHEVRTAMNKVRLRWQIEGTLRDQSEYRGQHLSKLSAVEQRLWSLMERNNNPSLELQILKTLMATIDSQSALVGLNKRTNVFQQNIQNNYTNSNTNSNTNSVSGSSIVAKGESLQAAANKLREMMKLEQIGAIS